MMKMKIDNNEKMGISFPVLSLFKDAKGYLYIYKFLGGYIL